MRACLPFLLALFLICLLPGGGAQAAEGQRFAHGFVIFKKVPSDQPVHYGGMLFISSKAGPVWIEYDIGQSKPFFLARDLFVSEINFGSLFEADFTSDKQLEVCKNIQTQLNDAARQSPGMVSAAKAAVAAIQAEVDRYQKGNIRISGSWVDKDAYESNTKAMEQARLAKAAAAKAEEEQLRASMAQAAANDKVRQDNLTFKYASDSARYLAMQSNYEEFVISALGISKAGGTMPAQLTPDYPDLIELPMFKDAVTKLLVLSKGSSPSAGAMICAFNGSAQPVAADIAFQLIFDPATHTLINEDEITSLKQILGKFGPQLMDGLPDALASTHLRNLRKGEDAPDKLTVTHLNLPKFSVDYQIDVPHAYQPPGQAQAKAQAKPQEEIFVLMQIRPAQ